MLNYMIGTIETSSCVFHDMLKIFDSVLQYYSAEDKIYFLRIFLVKISSNYYHSSKTCKRKELLIYQTSSKKGCWLLYLEKAVRRLFYSKSMIFVKDFILQSKKAINHSNIEILEKINNRHCILFEQKKIIFEIKPFLFLDLDDTLIRNVKDNSQYDFLITIGRNSHYIKLRPFLINFLEKMNEYYNVILFSASSKEYACSIARVIGINYFKLILHRDYCSKFEWLYYKDLRLIGCDLAKSVLIDNNPFHYIMQPLNGIKVKKYVTDDNELEIIGHKLERICTLKDTRIVLNPLLYDSESISECLFDKLPL